MNTFKGFHLFLFILAVSFILLPSTPQLICQETQSQRKEIIRFTFGWPSNIVADIEQTETYERKVRDKLHRTSIFTRYTLTAQKDREGYLIIPSAPTSVRVTEYPRDTSLSGLLLSTGTGIPSFFVDERGNFVGIADIKSYWSMVDTIISRRIQDPIQVAYLKSLFDSLYTPTTLRDIAIDTWNPMVGLWCEDVVPVGTNLDVMLHIPSRYAAGNKLSTNVRYSLTKRPPCTTASDTGLCVDITCQLIRDPVSYRVWYNRYYKRIGELTKDPDLASIEFQNFDSREDVRLTIDPQTMLASKVFTRDITTGKVLIENRLFDFSSRQESTMKIIYRKVDAWR
jgi:hypothetical protein